MSALWPRAAASAAIFRDGAVLLVRRGKPPAEGLWSLPGGSIEPGERAAAAALREVREETGIVARLAGVCDVVDALNAPNGKLQTHYVIAVYAGLWVSGEPQAMSDAREARFFALGEIAALPMTPGLPSVIESARGRLSEAR